MDPARGFTQSFARLAGFTLQHHNLTRAFRQLRSFRTQAAGLAQAGVDTPFHAKLGNVLAGSLTRLA